MTLDQYEAIRALLVRACRQDLADALQNTQGFATAQENQRLRNLCRTMYSERYINEWVAGVGEFAPEEKLLRAIFTKDKPV